LLDLFQCLAFCLRQEEVDKDGAQQGAPGVEEESPVFAHHLQHVWEKKTATNVQNSWKEELMAPSKTRYSVGNISIGNISIGIVKSLLETSK
jgi:hypothetical protein